MAGGHSFWLISVEEVGDRRISWQLPPWVGISGPKSLLRIENPKVGHPKLILVL
jgi:hypothetical protein